MNPQELFDEMASRYNRLMQAIDVHDMADANVQFLAHSACASAITAATRGSLMALAEIQPRPLPTSPKGH